MFTSRLIIINEYLCLPPRHLKLSGASDKNGYHTKVGNNFVWHNFQIQRSKVIERPQSIDLENKNKGAHYHLIWSGCSNFCYSTPTVTFDSFLKYQSLSFRILILLSYGERAFENSTKIDGNEIQITYKGI